MLQYDVKRSEDFGKAVKNFEAEMEGWIGDCIEKYAGAEPTDGHDQLTYTTAWEPYIRKTGNDRALPFMKDARDATARHFRESGAWQHGYWKMQEAHHGTEHFELFIGAICRLDPDDQESVDQLLDAAEHFGNWSDAVPPWFNYETGLYRSIFFGAEGVREEPGTELNAADHLRCLNILLLAHDNGGGERYADLAKTYGGKWAKALVEREQIPLGLLESGPLYSLTDEMRSTYKRIVGMAGDLDDELERAENLLASGGVDALLKLWTLSDKDALYKKAAEKILDLLATQLHDPCAGPAADAIRTYRRVTGDKRYDDAVIEAADKLDPATIQQIAMEPEVPRDTRPAGIGKRTDMPDWFENGKPRSHNPILLAVLAEIKDDEALATEALDLARAYMVLARQAYPDGREHGCSARTVSAIARGHGRNNHAGMATAVYGPLAELFA